MEGFLIIGAVVIVLAISLFWLRPAKTKCPACKSKPITKINQTAGNVRPYDPVPVVLAAGVRC